MLQQKGNIRKVGDFSEMPKIIDVEKSQYLTESIQKYAQNKVGQYSKFVDRNPLFVTYLSVNEAQSISDLGTGVVHDDVGPKSPVRYNRINRLPTYNIPELKPNVEYEDKGYDIDLEINDAYVLPGTVKPRVGDYLIIALPSSVELAFRVNQWGNNTIQSNDYYTFSADLKYTGKDLILRFQRQIVDEFDTIFDNIGTQDKCFIRSRDIEKIKAVGLVVDELKDLYYQNYFDKDTGCFVCRNNDENPEEGSEAWLYDKYVEKFIMDSKIYYSSTSDETIMLTNADIVENSDKLYPQTLFRAVLHQDTAYLCRFPWHWQVDIQKRLSTFIIHHIDVKSLNLHMTTYPLLDDHSDGLDSGYLMEYFPHGLIHRILDDDGIEDKIDHKYDPHKCEGGSQWAVRKKMMEVDDDSAIDDFSHEIDLENMSLQDKIALYNGEQPEEHESEEHTVYYDPSIRDDSYEFTYLDEIVYAHMLNQKYDINRRKLVRFALQINNYVYRMMPIVIYILKKYYDSYFIREDTEEL